MVDSKTLEKGIRAIIKNPEILIVFPDHLKPKKIGKKMQKLSFVIRYVLCRYKAKEMCHKFIIENGGMLTFIPHCYNHQKISDKPVDTYSFAI